MKKFLLKLLLFFSVPVIVCVLCTMIFWIRLPNISFAVPEDKTIVFLGDSHFTVGVESERIPHSYNFSEHGDHYINQFLRLEKLLGQNPQIHTVFVSVWPSSLSPSGDNRFFCNYGMQTRFVYNFPLYTSEEWRLQLEHSPTRVFKFMFEKPKGILSRAFKSDNFLRSRLGREDSGKINEVRGLHKKTPEQILESLKPDRVQNSCELQIKYLHKIVELVRSRGGRVVFVNTPMRNGDFFYDCEFFENLRTKEFGDVEYWNYQYFSIPDDDCWRDFHHLNRWGAEIFSRELARRMKEEGIL